MTIQVFNTAGQIQIDAEFPQAFQTSSGTISVGNGTSLSFPSRVDRPIMYFRPTSFNQRIFCTSLSETNALLWSMPGGNINWRVYSMSLTNQPSSGGFGIQVFNSSGSQIYNTNYNTFDIRQRNQFMANNSDSSTKTFSTSVTAFDGGLPFCIASPFTYDLILRGQSGPFVVVQYYAQGISFSSASSFNTAQAQMPNRNLTGQGAIGCYPRIVYLVR